MAVPTPYSYRQYAGNGTIRDFSVPFPYLERAHVRVYLGFNLLDGTFTSELAQTTGFTWTSDTAIQTVAAPATGATLTVIRQTPNGQQLVEWVDGSSLISADLNTSDKQNLYVVQEQQDRNDAGIAQSTAATATANTAISTANTAASSASAAVTTANTANANASSALTTAGTANADASTAVATANSANATAGVASTNASTAATTANTAASTANAANAKSDAAIAAVSDSLAYTPITNVAGIPASPANNTYIEVANSTGLQSFGPLAGIPVGFVGDSGLTVRLRYTTSPATWTWLNYFANNSDTRYLRLAGGTLTGPLMLSGAPTDSLHPASKGYADAGDSTVATAATAAQSTANTAVTNAATAQSTANTAVTNAATAQSTANTAVTNAATAQSTANNAITPAGAVHYFALRAAPTGYLPANGAEPAIAAYSTLYNALTNSGTVFPFGANTNGSGSAGSTHFRLPDLRGEFIRGWADGRTVDTGRTFGSTQADDFKSHSHTMPYVLASITSTTGTGLRLAFGTGAVTNETGGTETRPRNIALLSCIKF